MKNTFFIISIKLCSVCVSAQSSYEIGPAFNLDNVSPGRYGKGYFSSGNICQLNENECSFFSVCQSFPYLGSGIRSLNAFAGIKKESAALSFKLSSLKFGDLNASKIMLGVTKRLSRKIAVGTESGLLFYDRKWSGMPTVNINQFSLILRPDDRFTFGLKTAITLLKQVSGSRFKFDEIMLESGLGYDVSEKLYLGICIAKNREVLNRRVTMGYQPFRNAHVIYAYEMPACSHQFSFDFPVYKSLDIGVGFSRHPVLGFTNIFIVNYEFEKRN